MPLPPTIRLRSVVDAIDPAKDIDGIHPLNAGLLRLGYDGFLPATAHAAVEILRRSGIEIEGKRAVVVGRSAVVGMPAAFLLVRENATVTVCHSRTRDLARQVKDAEILVVAAGHPGLIRGDMVRRGAVVVDVGINVVDGAIVGDVEFESARAVASAITPVPGGVGPLTNALLLAHLVRAAPGGGRGERGRRRRRHAATPSAVPATVPSTRPATEEPDELPVRSRDRALRHAAADHGRRPRPRACTTTRSSRTGTRRRRSRSRGSSGSRPSTRAASTSSSPRSARRPSARASRRRPSDWPRA